MITKTIGTTGRDYSTLQSWEDAIAATLTDNNTGECYNDSEFSGAAVLLTVAGHTMGSFSITLKCAAGQSFRDNASVQTNGLRYNQSNGVGIRMTAAYDSAIILGNQAVHLHGLQIKTDGSTSTACLNGGQADNGNYDYCIFQADSAGAGLGIVYNVYGKCRNCLLISTAQSHKAISGGYAVGEFHYCTIVRVSGAGTGGAVFTSLGGSSTYTVKNCAWFGYGTESSGSPTLTGNNNCSDLAISFGTSNQASKTYANQFVSNSGTLDFKIKTGSDCADTGATDSTNGANDIAGTARPSGSAYDIGCWELVAAASGGMKRTWRLGTLGAGA